MKQAPRLTLSQNTSATASHQPSALASALYGCRAELLLFSLPHKRHRLVLHSGVNQGAGWILKNQLVQTFRLNPRALPARLVNAPAHEYSAGDGRRSAGGKGGQGWGEGKY